MNTDYTDQKIAKIAGIAKIENLSRSSPCLRVSVVGFSYLL